MTDFVPKNLSNRREKMTVSRYVSAEINHQKVPTATAGVELDKNKATIWGESYYGGQGTSKFAGCGVGVQQTVFEKNNNSIYAGGQVAYEKGHSRYDNVNENYSNVKGMATLGYQREFNDRTSGYGEINVGMQGYSSNVGPAFAKPSYDVTLGVERKFKDTRGRFEVFAENFPTINNGKKTTENYAGVRLTLLF